MRESLLYTNYDCTSQYYYITNNGECFDAGSTMILLPSTTSSFKNNQHTEQLCKISVYSLFRILLMRHHQKLVSVESDIERVS